MKTKTLLSLFLLINLYVKSYSQTTNDTKDMVSKFFHYFEKESSDKALDFLFSSNSYINSEEIEPIKKRIKQYKEILGSYSGYELLIKQDVVKSITVYSYIVNYDRQPLRFIFTFYKAKDKWKIFNFKISDDFISEVENGVIKLSYEKN